MKLRIVPFRDWNLNSKLISVYSLTIFIPVIIVTLLGFDRYNDNLKLKVGEYGLNLTDQVSKNLDTYIQQIDRLSLTFYLDVWENLSLNPDRSNPKEVLMEKVSIDRALRSIMVVIPFSDVLGAYWINGGEVFYSQYGNGEWIDHSDFEQQDWYREALKRDGKGVLVSPYPSKNNEQYILTYARSIVNVQNRQSYGVLLFDISMDGLRDLVGKMKSKSAGTMIILDNENKVVYHPDESLIRSSFPLKTTQPYGYYTDDIDGKETMIHYVRSSVTGWTVVNAIEVQQLSDELSLLRNLLFSYTGVMLLVSTVLFALLSFTIIKPLKEMKRLMRRVEVGDYEVQFQVRSGDEVNRLGHSFNVMVFQIRELINKVLKMKIYRQQAEVQVLRSQINPHFLYNTLESIHMKAEINSDYEVADMVASLGKLFRLSLRQTAERIPLFKELEYVNVFMGLQSVRFPKMEYIVDVPPDLMRTDILPWIVQPLVENAIIHGLTPKKGEGWIQISARTMEDDLVIEVADNGIGISDGRLDWLMKALQEQESEETGDHIGVNNVHRRIQHYYGHGYGLRIENRPEGGTTAEIRLRTMKEAEEDA
ncbi:sensor histidine kinase [Cohnella herbarum]|uniref:Sensor histidine kinase n=1 Tax=Cohnella herbarum TaxID=2728023 RepID=A0A7Z2VLU7_9BACL|nr:sensor histidine kinase [Cohnella herbarum]QJD85434.1 sensor histidine kinase [Cohnella herbarum]